jgi:hypothetical protein
VIRFFPVYDRVNSSGRVRQLLSSLITIGNACSGRKHSSRDSCTYEYLNESGKDAVMYFIIPAYPTIVVWARLDVSKQQERVHPVLLND